MKKILLSIFILIFLSGCAKVEKKAEVEKILEVHFPTEEEIKEKELEAEKKSIEEQEKSVGEKVKDQPEKEKIEEEPKKEIALLPKKEIPAVPKEKKEVIPPIPKIFLMEWNGECLIYDLKWNSINFGKAIFICGEEKDYYRLVGITIPDGLPAQMGYGYNRTDSFIDKKTGKVRYFYLYSKTGKTEKITEIFFNWSANQYTSLERNLKDKKVLSLKRNVIKFEGDIFDCLSVFYLLRNIDSENLKDVEFPIALVEKWYLKINFKGRMVKNLPSGEKKEVFILEPLLRSEKEALKKSRVNIWVTADREKKPVYFEGKLPIGKATIILSEAKRFDFKLYNDVNKILEDVVSSL